MRISTIFCAILCAMLPLAAYAQDTGQAQGSPKRKATVGLFMETGGTFKKMTGVKPIATTSNASGAFLYRKSEFKSEYPKAHAGLVSASSTPVFKICFAEPDSTALTARNRNWKFIASNDPSDFLLIRVENKDKDNVRLVHFAEGKGFITNMKTKSGIKMKDLIDVDVEELDDNTFLITPKEPLENGEYAFVYQGPVPPNIGDDSIFDFSVQHPAEGPEK